ncbi:MAG: polyribonucleotide nucleotidyltransferase [Chitinophagaceae bacterium]|nr:polyribonucleotide nucleotidyltransferase [Chitinophagaceae bacterium]
MFNVKTKTFDIGDGRMITIETGRMARQANGSALVTMGKCAILATVVANLEPKVGQSFFPLSVDYQEKFAAAGRIPGSFFKREGRLSDYEILISRLIDRALRPLFPDDYLCDVQVLVTLVSSDPEIMPDALACLAASAALAVSDVPVEEIISEVRVSRINGAFVINPTRSQMKDSDMDFIVAATEKNIMMVEGEAQECSEADLVAAIEAAHAAIRIQVQAQKELWEMVGSPAKRDYTKPYRNEELNDKVKAFASDKIYTIAKGALSKKLRSEGFDKIKAELVEHLGELSEEDAPLVGYYLHKLEKEIIRNMMIDEKIRLDGRALDVVRPLDMEVDVLPSPHGVSLFTRGETQSLSTVTLGTPEDEKLIEDAEKSEYSSFYLHYNFPPFSTGEIKPMRGPGRREVGHGNLAQRSLKHVIPVKEKFPYTIRIISDILESNGSSSMATVCAGSLALMDAGVPVEKHVGGVAMGLISRADGAWVVLTDILGDEDHLGDMDFKVTGTKDGICGIQMDIKVDGLSMDVMMKALEQARAGRLHILDAMYSCMPAHRDDLKPHAPRMEFMMIDKEFIGAVIGPGGKIIQEIQRETGTTITIEEVENKGHISIFSKEKTGLDRATEWIRGIVAVPEIGETYDAVVKSIMPFGAFVEFLPGKQGLVHISEISWKRLETMDGVFKEGDEIKVKLMGTDPKTGKYKFSRKVLLPKPEGMPDRPERSERPDRGDRNDRGDRKPHHGNKPHGDRKPRPQQEEENKPAE